MTFITIILSTMLVNNIVLTRLLGLTTFFGFKESIKSILKLTFFITLVLGLVTAIVYPIEKWIISQYNIDFLSLIMYVLVMVFTVFLLHNLLKLVYKDTLNPYKNLYVPTIFNSAILGTLLFNTMQVDSFLETIAFSIGSGLGYGLLMIIFYTIRFRLSAYKIPEALKGLPLDLIIAGLIGLSFLGFSGLL